MEKSWQVGSENTRLVLEPPVPSVSPGPQMRPRANHLSRQSQKTGCGLLQNPSLIVCMKKVHLENESRVGFSSLPRRSCFVIGTAMSRYQGVPSGLRTNWQKTRTSPNVSLHSMYCEMEVNELFPWSIFRNVSLPCLRGHGRFDGSATKHGHHMGVLAKFDYNAPTTTSIGMNWTSG